MTCPARWCPRLVPQLSHEYGELGTRYLSDALQVIGPGVKTGIPIRTENPHETGPDRLVNAVAAYDRVGAACVVVDFGTTINYDIVSAEGELLGAIFTPASRSRSRRSRSARPGCRRSRSRRRAS